MSKDIIVEVNIADDDYKNSLGYLESALEKIKNDLDHGFPQEEVDRLLKTEQEMQEACKSFEDGLTKIQETFSKFNEVFTKNMEGVRKFFETLHELTKKGWFISDHIISKYTLGELQELISLDDEGVGIYLMKKHGSKNEIRSKLKFASSQFPNRKDILDEIAKAYDKGMYNSVVSLCYTQADGICRDIWSHGFFDKDRRDEFKLRLFKNLEGFDLGVASYLVSHAGLSYNEITKHSGDEMFQSQEVKEKSYNRHLVLHGHSIEYGNKTNAFRAILLIDFLVYSAKEWRESEMK